MNSADTISTDAGSADPLAVDIEIVRDWLIGGAASAIIVDKAAYAPISAVALMAQVTERLVAAGLPLARAGVFIQTLHPEVFGRNFIWRPSTGVVVGSAPFDIQDSDEFKSSPLRQLYELGEDVRYRLDDPASFDFAFFEDMRREGVTDYIATPLVFIDGAIHATSWSTTHPQGFSETHIAAIRRIMPALSRLVESIGLRRVASTLMDTYVGSRAGSRILAGDIRRGHAESMRAAIWLSDMRGFTALSDRLPSESVVDVLNGFFDCQVAPIQAHGGEVLKFMGDGLFAVFPISDADHDLEDVCAKVLAAARESRNRVAALNYPYLSNVMDQIRFGIGLHVGQVLYGNIGGGSRLDFTCIGPAVNLAARLEKIAGGLGRTIVASSDFITASGDAWTDLGEFPLSGFTASERVYGLPEEV